jgi:hypothetical protein
VRKFASNAAATLGLAATSWGVWWYAPDLLTALGLDDLDIPGRVGAVFLFLTGVERAIERLRKQ